MRVDTLHERRLTRTCMLLMSMGLNILGGAIQHTSHAYADNGDRLFCRHDTILQFWQLHKLSLALVQRC